MLLSLLFWGVVLLPLILIIWAVSSQDDKNEFGPMSGAIFVTIAGLIAWWWFDVINLHWIISHPIHVAVIVVGYIVAGVIWATIKWWTLCRDKLKLYKAQEAVIKSEYEKRKSDIGFNYTYAEWVYSRYKFPPQPSNFKGQIMSWLVWWWASIVTTFIGDYIARFFRMIYDYLATIYTRIANSVFKDTGLTP